MRRHLMQSLIISFIFIYPQITPVAMAARGLEPVLIKDKQGKQVGLYNESYALVIGASRYTNGWPKLAGVRKDVKLVTGILEEHGFKVIPVNDPDKEQLRDAFEDFINQYGRKAENRLLFYFAGHGHTLKQSYGDEMGYIIPVDAPDPEKDLDRVMEKSMDMQQIEVFAKRIQSKHAIFLFDSCFSGSLFALSRAIPKSITYKTSKPVRQFITSGSAEETVPDKSTFREQFVAALEGEGDVNEDGYVTGTELGQFLQDTVINYTHESQHPQYGKIRNRNLDKGDFVFALRRVAYEQPVSLSSRPQAVDDFGFGNIDKRKKQRQEDENRLNAAKAEWSNWQKKLDSAYNKALEYDKDKYISTSEKAQMWKRLADSFSQDNPYSLTDQLIRSKAKDRLNYWKNYQAPKPAVKKPPVVIQNKPADGGTASINLRSYFGELSVYQVQSMSNMSISKKEDWGFYGHSTVSHSYKKRSISGDAVVVDQTTGLMWHQSGSDKSMTWNKAKRFVKKLNKTGYAGYRDWRLPKVEEAASLLESKKINYLYIDPLFSNKQGDIWTSNEYSSRGAWWSVCFNEGAVRACNLVPYSSHFTTRLRRNYYSRKCYVRPVRSGK